MTYYQKLEFQQAKQIAILFICLLFFKSIFPTDLNAADRYTPYSSILQLAQDAQLPKTVAPEADPKSVDEESLDEPQTKTGQPPKTQESKQLATDEEKEDFPIIERDLSKLPFPVRRMRELVLEAAKSGDIEKLRQLIGYGDDVTMLSLGGIDEDPIDFLKSLSGDDKGHEILAILTEVLESGYVLMDEGSEHELYVWPYFFAWPLDKLSPAQKVELYRLVTYGDYEDMESFGAYIFYRVGITPRGRWRFFVAGD